MYLLRSFAVWLLIIVIESIHGTFRQIVAAPVIGDLNARRIAFFIGSGLIALIAYLFSRWINAPSKRALLIVGAMWMGLTAGFEFGLGYYVLGYSSARMFEDYDISNGGLMGFGLLFLLFAPMIAMKLRGFRTAV